MAETSLGWVPLIPERRKVEGRGELGARCKGKGSSSLCNGYQLVNAGFQGRKGTISPKGPGVGASPRYQEKVC